MRGFLTQECGCGILKSRQHAHDRTSQRATPERERSKEVQKYLYRRFVRLRGGGASQGRALARATKINVSGSRMRLLHSFKSSSRYAPRPHVTAGDAQARTLEGSQCPIKAQGTARVGLTGPSLEYRKKRALGDPSQLQGKWASARATLLCACSVA